MAGRHLGEMSAGPLPPSLHHGEIIINVLNMFIINLAIIQMFIIKIFIIKISKLQNQNENKDGSLSFGASQEPALFALFHLKLS